MSPMQFFDPNLLAPVDSSHVTDVARNLGDTLNGNDNDLASGGLVSNGLLSAHDRYQTLGFPELKHVFASRPLN